MTRAQIESARARGLPFTLRMTDGKEYPLPHRDHLSLPPKASCVTGYDDAVHFNVLRLLMMAGLESTTAEGGSKSQ